ncbi:MAG: tRNA pseudouridine(55) synthase TruB [Mycobacteriales bacterium]
MTDAAVSGLLLVDKPAGCTSHDVVSRIRRLARTRRVGHAGTLDPMATGLLVVGIEKATRLLGHLSGHDKDYTGSIVLGVTTSTDDADGEVVDFLDASGVTDEAITAAVASFVGDILQVPPGVSAIKVDGVRSYTRARRGETLELPARPVSVAAFEVTAIRRPGATIEVDVACTVSSGTYIRGLARDVGGALGVGGHLSALRRTRIGGYSLERAHTLDDLQARADAGDIGSVVFRLADAVAAAFHRRDVDAETAIRVGHGAKLPASGLGPGPVGVFGPDGDVLALMEDRGDSAAALCVFVGQ